MGGFSGAHQFCKIGAHAFLGMYSGVNRDVPAYTMVSGHPACRAVSTARAQATRLRRDQIRNIKDAYRLVYRKGMKLADAIDAIAALAPENDELELFLESLRSSERGLVR